MRQVRRYFLTLCFIFTAFGSGLHAAGAQGNSNFSQGVEHVEAEKQPPLVQKVALLAFLSMLPFIIMLLTSFLKMVVVLSLLRQALGVQNSPPNAVINGMAILMSIYVMFPTGLAMYKEAETYIEQEAPKNANLMDEASIEYLIGVIDRGKEPMRKFLVRNTTPKHTNFFYQLAKQKFPKPYKNELKSDDFIVLIPAYITSQVNIA